MPDDQDLLQRHLAGDVQAFTLLVERHRQLVWGMARALTDEAAADDCCQAVFLLLDRKAKRLHGSNRPLAEWLLACVRRVAANHRRAAAAIPTPDEEQVDF